MPIQIQLRRGTAAEWTAADPTLAQGEMGLETDTGKFKVGDGLTAWTSLAYSSGPAGPTGATGATGAPGADGVGVPTGGAAGQILAKIDGTDYNTEWAAGMTNPMTTAGDVIVGDTGGAPVRLAKGADSQVLTVDPATHLLAWATPSASVTEITHIPTAETDTSKRLAPDGAGGVAWAAGGSSVLSPYVQSARSGPTNASSYGATLGVAPTVGNLLIACVVNEGATTVNSITQTNVTWTLMVRATGANGRSELWLGVPSASPGTAATAAMSGGTWGSLTILELVGTGLSGIIDLTATSSFSYNSSSSPLNQVGPLTPSVSSALVVAALGHSGYSSNYGGLASCSPGLQCIPSAWADRVYPPIAFGLPGRVPCGLQDPYPAVWGGTGTGCIASIK